VHVGPLALADIAGHLRARLATALGPDDAPPRVIVVAAGRPFATTSYARARLLRQLHATGLCRNRSHGP
jgi:hypothetical protein